MVLAKSNDPYIDGSGKAIEADHVAMPDAFVLEEKRKILPIFRTLTATKRIDIDNAPEPEGSQQTVISAVVGMRLLGLSDVDIADMMGTNLDKIQSIVNLPATQATFERIYQNIIHTNSDHIQGRIASHAGRAVDVVVSMMDDEDTRDDVRLKAAQDILDRSGSHPDQFFGESGKSQQQDDELRIVIMDEEGKQERVKVDIKRGGK
jgi:hypothetical protein